MRIIEKFQTYSDQVAFINANLYAFVELAKLRADKKLEVEHEGDRL